jgi:hypothetical protein
MSMAPEFHIRKFANAFSKSTKLSPAVGDVPIAGGAAVSAVESYRKRFGGVWVGGVVEITNEGLSFGANALNRALNSGVSGKRIPMADIRSVRREFGWLTGIVVVEHKNGEFRFRCFGAKSVARRFSAYLAAR